MSGKRVHKIERMFAFISENEEGEEEGICAFRDRTMWMPMVGADNDRVKSLRPIAEDMVRVQKIKIKLVYFSREEVFEEIK